MERKLFLASMLILLVGATWTWGANIDTELAYKKKTSIAGPVTKLFRFSLWDAETAGNMVWSEEKKAKVNASGVISTFLGDTVPLDPGVFSQQLWVQVDKVKAGSIYTPVGLRDKLGVVPYALSSGPSVEVLKAICGIYYATKTALPDMCKNVKLVFTTSETYTGDLGGLAGADAKCQALAETAGLWGTFKAWLSDSSATASERLNHSTVPYMRTDGRIVATDWVDLTDGTINVALSVDENGTAINSGWGYAWTWTTADGSGGTPGWNCRDWTYSGGLPDKGENGFIYETNYKWSVIRSSDGCGESLYLYCFEQ
jgi:hypothetical protein